MPLHHHLPAARYSAAVVANGFVFLSGHVLAQIDRVLADCGSDKAHICEAVIYLPDMTDYAGMNRVWDAWVAPGKAPARACVQAALADAGWKVEIKITALRRTA